MDEGQHRKREMSRAFADCLPANKYARFELDLTSPWTWSLVFPMAHMHLLSMHFISPVPYPALTIQLLLYL